MADNTDANRAAHMKDPPFLPCDTIASANEDRGWTSKALPEPSRTAPRPDTPIAGNRGGD
jgi:hypothetical protein